MDASFDAPAEQAETVAKGMGENVFQGGFDALKAISPDSPDGGGARHGRSRFRPFPTVREARAALAEPGRAILAAERLSCARQ